MASQNDILDASWASSLHPEKSILNMTFPIGKTTKLFLLWGVVLRLTVFFVDPSLRLDELSVALLLRDNSLSGLLKPFSLLTQTHEYAYHTVTAPLGFLVMTKVLGAVFGYHELALRITPALCGLASIFLFHRITKKFLDGTSGLVAVLLFATHTPLIYYASEIKPYISDVVIALLLFYLAEQCLSGVFTRRRALIFGAVGAATIWFSFTAIFVLAGIGITLLFAWFREKHQGRSWLWPVLAMWAASFLINYETYLKIFTYNKALFNYWKGSYVTVFGMPFENCQWMGCFSRMGPSQTLMILGMTFFFIVGCYSLFKEKALRFYLYFLPIVFTLGASLLHRYPFYNRLILFLSSSSIIFLSRGIGRAWDFLSRRNTFLGVIFIGLILYKPLVYSFKATMFDPMISEHSRPVFEYLGEHHQPQDTIYIYYGSRSAFDYYAPRFGLDRASVMVGVSARGDQEKYRNDIEKLKGKNRVWFVFSHVYENEEDLFVHNLDRIGAQKLKEQSYGASVYLYDLSVKKP